VRRPKEQIEHPHGLLGLSTLMGRIACLGKRRQGRERPDRPLVRTPLCPSGREVLADVVLGPRPIRTLSRRDRCRPLDPLRPGSGTG